MILFTQVDIASGNRIKFMKILLENALSKMILSASGWRKIFVKSQNEQDDSSEISKEDELLSAAAAKVFIQFLRKKIDNPKIVVGMDSRPTGKSIVPALLKILAYENIHVVYVGITAAPEIMAFARNYDAFVYISASHNPIGHNGIKFGLNDGGVVDGEQAKELIAQYKNFCLSDEILKLKPILENQPIDTFLQFQSDNKQKALAFYTQFSKHVIADSANEHEQQDVFSAIAKGLKKNPLGILADMNGSARCVSIDKQFFTDCGFDFYAINDSVGKIAHEIIPEPENLVFCSQKMTELQTQGIKNCVLGYMPDCDGDRGNIVYWNEKKSCAEILKAQEVFALCVLSELAYLKYQNCTKKIAVVANDPTSMRVDEIAQKFNAQVFRAEVGEANVVNLARKKRAEGYVVRILGEGSNGGNITYPASVRDPMNTLFSLIKLLTLRDEYDEKGSCVKKGLFHLWLSVLQKETLYTDDFSLADIIETLPVFVTTGVSEERAILKITTRDHAILKKNYQSLFADYWLKNEAFFKEKGIVSWQALCNNGITETAHLTDFSISGRGGLKILFSDKDENPLGYIWMRGSGTEPVFRVMCDWKGDDILIEHELLALHRKLIEKSDNLN